jgi:hypothetical protein
MEEYLNKYSIIDEHESKISETISNASLDVYKSLDLYKD